MLFFLNTKCIRKNNKIVPMKLQEDYLIRGNLKKLCLRNDTYKLTYNMLQKIDLLNLENEQDENMTVNAL